MINNLGIIYSSTIYTQRHNKLCFRSLTGSALQFAISHVNRPLVSIPFHQEYPGDFVSCAQTSSKKPLRPSRTGHCSCQPDFEKEDFSDNKPFIGIANSYNDIIPGHIHLNDLTQEVKRGIRDAGGVPFEWGVPGVCDGIAMYAEMRLSLPSRDHIADNIEIMVLSHSLDGWVGVTNCDKITPGMLMAAGRLDLPAPSFSPAGR